MQPFGKNRYQNVQPDRDKGAAGSAFSPAVDTPDAPQVEARPTAATVADSIAIIGDQANT